MGRRSTGKERPTWPLAPCLCTRAHMPMWRMRSPTMTRTGAPFGGGFHRSLRHRDCERRADSKVKTINERETPTRVGGVFGGVIGPVPGLVVALVSRLTSGRRFHLERKRPVWTYGFRRRPSPGLAAHHDGCGKERRRKLELRLPPSGARRATAPPVGVVVGGPLLGVEPPDPTACASALEGTP